MTSVVKTKSAKDIRNGIFSISHYNFDGADIKEILKSELI